jgi:hypothetical protein
VKVDFGWAANNYLGMSRFLETAVKLIILTVMACLLQRFNYTDYPSVYLITLFTAGITIAIRFFIFVPLHNLLMNQLEIFRGVMLALFAIL